MLLPPPAIVESAPLGADIERLLSIHVHPASDPALVAGLRRLLRDSATARGLLEDLSKQERVVVMTLVPFREKDYVALGVLKTPAGYDIRTGVQMRLAETSQDCVEPWIATSLFCLLDAARNGDFVAVTANLSHFSEQVADRMWKMQQTIRKELLAAGADPTRRIHANGKALFNLVVLKRIISS